MRQKFSFKRGVLKFAAIASVLAFTAGQFGGSLTAFAEGQTTAQASTTQNAESPSTSGGDAQDKSGYTIQNGTLTISGKADVSGIDTDSVTKIVLESGATGVDAAFWDNFKNLINIENNSGSSVTLSYDETRNSFWRNNKTTYVTSLASGDTVNKGYYAKYYVDGEMKDAYYITAGQTFDKTTKVTNVTTWYDENGNVYDFSKTVTGVVRLYNTPDGAKSSSSTSPVVTVTTGKPDDDDDTDSTTSTTAATKATSVTVSGTNSKTVANKIKDVAAGSTVTVNMSSIKTVAKNILEAAKGKNVNVVLDMNGYKWTINGSSIGSDLHDVNMNVNFGANNIPQDAISSLAGNDSYKTISLDYDGPFGFTGFLSFDVGSANAGKYVNLYYYNADKQLEYQNSGIVDKNGNTSLSFSHASEYVAIISDTKASATSAVKTTSATSPITADAAMTVPFILLMFAAAAVMFGARAYKKRHI
jgi:hypothetical protein